MFAIAVLSLPVFGQIFGFLVGRYFDHVFKYLAQQGGDIYLEYCSKNITENYRLRIVDLEMHFSILMRFCCWTYCQMFRGTSSSNIMSIGMITSLEMNILLHMTRKCTRDFRVDLFVPIMSFAPQIQLQVAPPPQLVTGGEDLT